MFSLESVSVVNIVGVREYPPDIFPSYYPNFLNKTVSLHSRTHPRPLSARFGAYTLRLRGETSTEGNWWSRVGKNTQKLLCQMRITPNDYS